MVKDFRAHAKTVYQYTMDLTCIGKFGSVTDASAKTGIGKSKISECANRKPSRRSAGGYIWSFEVLKPLIIKGTLIRGLKKIWYANNSIVFLEKTDGEFRWIFTRVQSCGSITPNQAMVIAKYHKLTQDALMALSKKQASIIISIEKKMRYKNNSSIQLQPAKHFNTFYYPLQQVYFKQIGRSTPKVLPNPMMNEEQPKPYDEQFENPIMIQEPLTGYSKE